MGRIRWKVRLTLTQTRLFIGSERRPGRGACPGHDREHGLVRRRRRPEPPWVRRRRGRDAGRALRRAAALPAFSRSGRVRRHRSTPMPGMRGWRTRPTRSCGYWDESNAGSQANPEVAFRRKLDHGEPGGRIGRLRRRPGVARAAWTSSQGKLLDVGLIPADAVRVVGNYALTMTGSTVTPPGSTRTGRSSRGGGGGLNPRAAARIPCRSRSPAWRASASATARAAPWHSARTGWKQATSTPHARCRSGATAASALRRGAERRLRRRGLHRLYPQKMLAPFARLGLSG